MKQNLLLLIFLCSTLLLSAQTEIGGIAYTFNGTEATVTSKSEKYQGDIVIPASVENDGVTYNVTAIEELAFSRCNSLSSVTISKGITTIGDWAFYFCSSLTSITIPESVTTIGYSAFDGCSSLAEIDIDPNNANYSSAGGILYNKAKTKLITCPGGSTEAAIENSVTTIRNNAFYYCISLTSITIPKGVTAMGSAPFMYCSSLTEINVDLNNTNYSSENGVLYNKDKTTLIACPEGSTEVTIENSVKTIGFRAFCFCSSLSSITIPEGVTTIEGSAFYGCSSLTSITIPESVTTIEYKAFNACSSLTKINVDLNNTNYCSAGGVLYNKNRTTTLLTCPGGSTEVAIENSVTTIGDYAFEGCNSLTSVTIPKGVTTIGYSAFKYCPSLTTITIPESVTTIGGQAFYGCSSLTEFYSYNTSPISIDEGVFNNFNQSNCILYVPKGSVDEYNEADYWKDFAEIREMPTVGIEDVFDTNGSSNANINIYTRNNHIIINGTQAGEAVALYSINGTLLQNVVSTGAQITMLATEGNIYLVKTTRKAVKVVL